MTRSERKRLHRLFKLHFGESAAIARDLDVTPCSVSLWFAGQTNSARIQAAIVARAQQLSNKAA